MLTQGKNITDKCHAMCNAAKIARNAHLQWNLNYEKVCLHCTNKHTQEHLTPHRKYYCRFPPVLFLLADQSRHIYVELSHRITDETP